MHINDQSRPSLELAVHSLCMHICDRLCENRPCSHLLVSRETLVQKIELKLTAFAHARPLLFSRTGLSNLLNKIQFTFEVAPCLILGLFR